MDGTKTYRDPVDDFEGESEGKSEEGSENDWGSGSGNESTDNRDDESGMTST